MSDFDYMNECMTRDLAIMLMENEGVTMSKALDTVFESETFNKLQDPETGLYFQSPAYLYDLLQKELKRGKLES